MPILKRNLRGYAKEYTIQISGGIKDKKGMSVPASLGRSGYLFVNLRKEGRTINKRVDKLVAHNWLANPKKKEEIIHLDGIKTNNYPHNLRWATEKEYKAYKVPVKESNGVARIKSVVVTDTHTKKQTQYNSPKKASEAIGLPASKIRKALRDSLTINNFKFSYS